jgi:hypothetical protein
MWADRSNVSLFSDGFGFNALQNKMQINKWIFISWIKRLYLHVSGGNLQICCCRFEHGAVTFQHCFIVALQLNLNLLVQFVRNGWSYRRNGRLTFCVKKTPAQQSALARRATRA